MTLMDGTVTFGFTDIMGKRVQKTPFECPYSYDTFVTFKRDWKQNDSAVYSDRLMQWDMNKFNRCCLDVWGNKGQFFDARRPEHIQEFLSKYLEEDILLTGIEQGCNISNGYPYWVFYYRKK